MDIVSKNLAEFFTLEEITDWRRKITLSLASRASEKLSINSLSQDGQTHSAIELSTPAEKEAFLARLEEAATIKEEGDASPASHHTDFSQTHVEP